MLGKADFKVLLKWRSKMKHQAERDAAAKVTKRLSMHGCCRHLFLFNQSCHGFVVHSPRQKRVTQKTLLCRLTLLQRLPWQRRAWTTS